MKIRKESLLPFKPTLPYPDPAGKCIVCESAINESEFFGFLWGYLFCWKHYRYYRMITKSSFIKRFGKATDMRPGSIPS